MIPTELGRALGIDPSSDEFFTEHVQVMIMGRGDTKGALAKVYRICSGDYAGQTTFISITPDPMTPSGPASIALPGGCYELVPDDAIGNETGFWKPSPGYPPTVTAKAV